MPPFTSNNPHFVENFQDSQAAQSQFNQSRGPMDPQEDGQPIQLVKIRKSGKVQLLPKARDIIASCDLPVGFVCLAGKYRTGKSFLLNKLLYLDGKGFQVDSSTEACTQGIWMWSRPFYNEKLNNYIFFLDTQGSQSLTKDVNNDTIIFVLSALLSSYFIYNSVGSIDQKSINELNVVTKLSMNILAEQNIRNSDNQDVLYRYMPKFMWLLRDFTLQMRRQDGRRMNSRQYMQDCLTQQNSLIRGSQQSKKIRRALNNYFKERDCLTLVRPAREQKDLYRLDELPEHALRREFIEGVNLLRQKIMKQAGPKIYDNTPLYGSSITLMLENYIESINSNGFPTIKTAWEQISDDEGAFAYNRALQVYNQLYSQNFDEDEPKGEEIHKILITLRDQTMTEFNRNLSQPNDAYHNKLKQFLTEKEQAILDVNKKLNECKNVQILKQCVSNMMNNIESGAYQEKPENLNKDYETAISQYKLRAKGQNKGQILSQFTTNMLPIILQIQKPKKPKEDPQAEMRKNKQFQKKMQLMQKRVAALTNELSSKDKQIQMIKKSNLTQQSQNPRDKKGRGKQNKSTGCCGGGDCAIM